MKIEVRINEEGVLRNRRYAFTDRFALVTKLLRNARHAGACRIVVDHQADAKMLREHDDGRGIEDFQKLLSFHESGWDANTAAQEYPFRIGLTKCLFGATPVEPLRSQLDKFHLGKYPLLHGGHFESTVGVGAVPCCSVELVDAAEGGGDAER